MAEKNLSHHPAPVPSLADIKEGADKLLLCSYVFTAFHELFQPSKTAADILLSDPGREGLAYMFKLLADDAVDLYQPLFAAWEELKMAHNRREEEVEA